MQPMIGTMGTETTAGPWVVFDYESEMFFVLNSVLAERMVVPQMARPQVRSALIESELLHIRVLCGLLLDPRHASRPDDIVLDDLKLPCKPKRLEELRIAYGDKNTGPRAELNKHLAHATSLRSSSRDWKELINLLSPILCDVISEINKQRHSKPSVRSASRI
jgi:hypothetical protein